ISPTDAERSTSQPSEPRPGEIRTSHATNSRATGLLASSDSTARRCSRVSTTSPTRNDGLAEDRGSGGQRRSLCSSMPTSRASRPGTEWGGVKRREEYGPGAASTTPGFCCTWDARRSRSPYPGNARSGSSALFRRRIRSRVKPHARSLGMKAYTTIPPASQEDQARRTASDWSPEVSSAAAIEAESGTAKPSRDGSHPKPCTKSVNTDGDRIVVSNTKP